MRQREREYGVEHVERQGETGACVLVERGSYAELSGGKEGTASALIDALQARQRGDGGESSVPRV